MICPKLEKKKKKNANKRWFQNKLQHLSLWSLHKGKWYTRQSLASHLNFNCVPLSLNGTLFKCSSGSVWRVEVLTDYLDDCRMYHELVRQAAEQNWSERPLIG